MKTSQIAVRATIVVHNRVQVFETHLVQEPESVSNLNEGEKADVAHK